MSRTVCLLAILLTVLSPALAQNKIGLSVHVGSGASWFGGKDAVNSTTFYPSNVTLTSHRVDSAYGKKLMTNWLAGLQAEYWPPATNWSLGLLAQLEYVGGKAHINKISTGSGTTATDGEFVKGATFISINPQAGKVFILGKNAYCLRGGLDYAFHMDGSEEMRTPGQNNWPNIIGYSGVRGKNDFRVTADLLIAIGPKWLFNIGYKHGLKKYGDSKAYLRALQCRLSFLIIKPKSSGSHKF